MNGGFLVLITKVNNIFNFDTHADFKVTGDVLLDLCKWGIVIETPYSIP